MNTAIPDDRFPKIFRPDQIENFMFKLEEASIFRKDDNIIHDEFIALVIDEVRTNEADLSQARVAVEKYIISELVKEPNSEYFMRLYDKVKPIIVEVIEIEIKMFGKPKYIISSSNNSADVWRIDGGAQTPIESISLPTDVADEVKKYSFVSVKDNTNLVLPEETEKDVKDIRLSFFNELDSDDDKKSQEEKEKTWLINFEQEAIFNLIDSVILAANFHEQVSLSLVTQLKDYCLYGIVHGVEKERDELAVSYEDVCDVVEVDVAPGRFIFTARNSSLRALFTALMLSEDSNKDLLYVIVDKDLDINKEVCEEFFENTEDIHKIKNSCIVSLIKLYAKHPIFEEDVRSLKLVFNAITQELRQHFYVALNDFASYYSERNFHNSSSNCFLLKEYLTTLNEIQESDLEPKLKTNETENDQSETDEKASNKVEISNEGIFIV